MGEFCVMCVFCAGRTDAGERWTMAATVPQLRTYRVVLEWDDEDPENAGWVVTVPALPGCVTQGDTVAEALRNAEEAISGHVAALADIGAPIPDGDAASSFITVADPAVRR